jgi:hypothetical protein
MGQGVGRERLIWEVACKVRGGCALKMREVRVRCCQEIIQRVRERTQRIPKEVRVDLSMSD